jgi:hypothetical protein
MLLDRVPSQKTRGSNRSRQKTGKRFEEEKNMKFVTAGFTGGTMINRKKLSIAAAVVALIAVAAVAYAALPALSVPPGTVAHGTLAVSTPLNVLSTDAFTRAINQTQGSNAVLQHFLFAPGQSTGWHAHPGPNIVMVVGGDFTLIDQFCNETHYAADQGFATGLDVHEAIAGTNGADFYSLYFLPSDAQVLRNNESAPKCASR